MRCYLPLAVLLTLAGCYNMPGGDVTAGGSGANTVNGSIHVPAGTHSGAVGTVNGSIRIDDNATVASAGTVNGSVALGAHATADTVGILVKHGGGGWFNFGTHKPRIVIGPGAVVRGDLRFERAVELYVSDSATTGPITGATAIHFSGAAPTG